jgi:hypothetical protein
MRFHETFFYCYLSLFLQRLHYFFPPPAFSFFFKGYYTFSFLSPLPRFIPFSFVNFSHNQETLFFNFFICFFVQIGIFSYNSTPSINPIYSISSFVPSFNLGLFLSLILTNPLFFFYSNVTKINHFYNFLFLLKIHLLFKILKIHKML